MMPLVTLPDYDYYNLVNRDHALAQGLVSWWRVMPGWYGGTIWRDLMKRNNATLTSMAMPYSSTSGMALGSIRPGGDGEVRFDGVNDYGLCALNTVVNMGSQDFSFACDIKPTSVSTFQIILGKDHNTGRQLVWGYGQTTGLLYINYYTGGLPVVFNGGAISANVVSHVLTQRVGNTFKVYKNGVLIASGTTSGTHGAMDSISADLDIGRRSFPGFFQYLSASLDNLQIRTRSLSASEVAALYQSSRLGHPGLLRRLTYRYISIPAAPVGVTYSNILGSRTSLMVGG